MKILMAEDNPVIQMTHRVRMGLWGYQLDIANNGIQAVNYAQQNNGQYDCCLMDVDMPKMNGLEATKLIRQTVRYFPIIGFSSNPEYQQQCLAVGMDDFIEKTCFPDRLLAKLRELTVKIVKVVNNKQLSLKKEMPMDSKHAKELRELAKQGLCRMRLDGPVDREVIVHKNTANKISHDFNIMKQSMTEFLNRDPDRPTVCDLYRGPKKCIIETFIENDDYQLRLATENEQMDSYTTKCYKSDEE